MRRSLLVLIMSLFFLVPSASAEDNAQAWVFVKNPLGSFTDSFSSTTSGGEYASVYGSQNYANGQAYAKYGPDAWYAAPGNGVGVYAASRFTKTVTSYASITDTLHIELPSGYNPDNYQGAVLKLSLSGSMQTISDWKAMYSPYYSNGGEGGYAYLGVQVKYGPTAFSSGGFILGPSNFVYPQKDFPIAGGGFMIQTDAKGNSLNVFLNPLNDYAESEINSKVALSSNDYSRLSSFDVPLYIPLPGYVLNSDQPVTFEMMALTGGMAAEAGFMNTFKLDTTEPLSLYSQDASGKYSLIHIADIGGTWGSASGLIMQKYTPPAVVTPEPASMLLYGLGAGAMALLRRRAHVRRS